VANTLDYLRKISFTALKSQIVQDPGVNVVKRFSLHLAVDQNKLVRLSLASYLSLE
jgi:hypothetical protein